MPNSEHTLSSFTNICIVGLGNHARTKLIPAALANGQTIVGLVSSRPFDDLPRVPVFPRIEQALDSLPPETLYVIATPPAVHFEQAMAVIVKGRDLILEKPAFVFEEDAQRALAEAKRNGTVVVEAFMHRYTDLYDRFMRFWTKEYGSIEEVDIAFVVPQVPTDTFRQNGAIASSGLYDIGSYALSLLADMNLPLEGIRLAHVESPGDGRSEAVRMSGVAEYVRVNILIGIQSEYSNRVSLKYADGRSVVFAPFFYGRLNDKTITTSANGRTTVETFRDVNAFEQMLAISRDEWLKNQTERCDSILRVTAALQRLGADLAGYRSKVTVPAKSA